MSGGGSSSRKGVGRRRGKGEKKGDPIVWEGSLGPDFYDEPLFEFPLESKSDFNRECPLRGYDSYKEDWPRCRHDLDCIVQMCTDENDGAGCRFFIGKSLLDPPPTIRGCLLYPQTMKRSNLPPELCKTG
jgi:hypothetical protein